ncbi:MAG: hypothetical protein GF418_01805 [Chitinivibrionales bacterium]|nr:hypothetical protein [Chitinivibrionales bacterium]MBD3394334.1 hypothetical protein [Chitinivibrionales bacterium]
MGFGKGSISQAGPSTRPLVLLFSPQDRVRNILVAGLYECGYQVIDTASHYLAIMKASTLAPRAAIIDITRTNNKGFALAVALRKSERTKHVSLLLMVPSRPENILQEIAAEYEGDDAGVPSAARVMRYPFSFAELVAAVESIVA